MGFFDFLSGTPERVEQYSNLDKRQKRNQNQYSRAVQKQGGAFGDVADYYRSNLSNDPADFQSYAAPEMRRFNEEIIPGLSEQFAGMGSGGLSSSGFRNAAVGAGTDLSERLGSIRAQLRQQSAQGLQNFAQGSLSPHQENVIRPGTEGFMDKIGPALVSGGIGFMTGGPVGAAAGAASSFGKSSPYGNRSGYSGSFGQLPNYGGF